MRNLVVALAAAAPLVTFAQASTAPTPTQAATTEATAPAAAAQTAPAPQYAPPPRYASPPQGQYAPAPQYYPPPQGQYAQPPQYAPPPQGQYAPAPQYYPPPQGQYAPPPQYPQGQYPTGYPPPPQYAPPAYPPPAPPAPRRYQRDGWYIGFGLGGGDGHVKDSDGTYSFKGYLGKSPTTVALEFKVGATLTPKLLAGLEISGVSSSADGGGGTATVTIVNYDLVATYFPMDRGLFLRGGLGLSRFTLDLENVPVFANGTYATYTGSDSVNGSNVALGIGYAWWLGEHFNLTANLDFSNQWWRGDQLGRPTRSDFWALGLGFDWY